MIEMLGTQAEVRTQNAETALAQCYSERFSQLTKSARNRGRVNDAEDAVQEATISVLLSIRSNNYTEQGKLPRYLLRAVINKAIDAGRADNRKDVSLSDNSENFIADEKSCKPEELVLIKEEIRAVQERAGELSPRQKDVIILLAQGYTRSEISDTLDISQIALRTHLSRAREKLRRVL